jgi:periplasmic divalent cation tolerance protein
VTDKIIVFSTCGSADEARKISRALVDSRAAACVSIVPAIESIYRWRGKVETAAEFMLVIKTRRPLLPRLINELRRVHSYEVPEAIAFQIVDGLPEYLDWIDHETGAVEDEKLA